MPLECQYGGEWSADPTGVRRRGCKLIGQETGRPSGNILETRCGACPGDLREAGFAAQIIALRKAPRTITQKAGGCKGCIAPVFTPEELAQAAARRAALGK